MVEGLVPRRLGMALHHEEELEDPNDHRGQTEHPQDGSRCSVEHLEPCALVLPWVVVAVVVPFAVAEARIASQEQFLQ